MKEYRAVWAAFLDFEVTREKKVQTFFPYGSFKEQVPKKVFKYGTPNPGFWLRASQGPRNAKPPLMMKPPRSLKGGCKCA